jgi:hypothetical protein
MARARDETILQRAAELGRIVFTQDDDFLPIADQWRKSGREFAGVIFAHQLRATIGQIIEDLSLIAKVATLQEMRNCVLFIPL